MQIFQFDSGDLYIACRNIDIVEDENGRFSVSPSANLDNEFPELHLYPVGFYLTKGNKKDNPVILPVIASKDCHLGKPAQGHRYTLRAALSRFLPSEHWFIKGCKFFYEADKPIRHGNGRKGHRKPVSMADMLLQSGISVKPMFQLQS